MSDHTELIERLREDAEDHAETAACCDCRPEDTVNWRHRLNAIAAADALQRQAEEIKALEAEVQRCKTSIALLMADAAEIEALRAALLCCARKAEALKRECGMDPESPQAIRNSQYQAISTTAHIALGMIQGPTGSAMQGVKG